jgi:hypothetical protein
MNQPIEPEDNFEQRIEQIEREIKHIRFTLEHVKLDTGSSRESLDAIERKQYEALRLLRGIRQTQADHGERFDELKQELHTHSEVWLKSLQENFDQFKEALVEIRATQGTHNERFDAMATKDDIAGIKATQDQILALLQQKPPNS